MSSSTEKIRSLPPGFRPLTADDMDRCYPHVGLVNALIAERIEEFKKTLMEVWGFLYFHPNDPKIHMHWVDFNAPGEVTHRSYLWPPEEIK